MKTDPFRWALTVLACLAAGTSAWGFAFITDDRAQGALPFKWEPGAIRIVIRLGTASTLTDGNSFNSSAQGAATAWNPHLGNVQFSAQTAAEGAATDHNGTNELAFANDVFGQAFDTNVLAVTTTWVTRGNQRTEGDIIFNRARTWNSYDGPTQGSVVDLQRVALHELGHLLGLDHPDEAGQTFTPPLPIMNSRITGNDLLTSDDIIGVQSLYGPPGTPANDNFASAFVLTLNSAGTATGSGHTTNATKQIGEPNHADNAGGRSVWWKWTAPSAGNVTLDTRGSYADTTLAVYTGTAVNALSTVTSNDDLSATPHIQASAVTFTAAAGVTYSFAVDGFDGDSAGVLLNLAFVSTGPSLPVITTQPVSTTVTSGGTASFTVVATGATSHQWQFNGSNIAGATGATHTLASATAANAGSYQVIVTNSVGSVTSSSVTLTVNAAPVTPPPTSGGGGGGGGGGGAPSLWFLGGMGMLGLTRWLLRRR